MCTEGTLLSLKNLYKILIKTSSKVPTTFKKFVTKLVLATRKFMPMSSQLCPRLGHSEPCVWLGQNTEKKKY